MAWVRDCCAVGLMLPPCVVASHAVEWVWAAGSSRATAVKLKRGE